MVHPQPQTLAVGPRWQDSSQNHARNRLTLPCAILEQDILSLVRHLRVIFSADGRLLIGAHPNLLGS